MCTGKGRGRSRRTKGFRDLTNGWQFDFAGPVEHQ